MARSSDVSVLFARHDSVYRTLSGCDVWDEARDARRWPGGTVVIAHPPCRSWGALRALSRPAPGERDLARWAVAQVRRWGGVLEHPARSTLWPDQGLPAPGQRDAWGGFTLPVSQKWWGHRAEKLTWLYVVGAAPRDVPAIPYVLGEATHVIAQSARRQRLRLRPEVTKSEREHTPIALARWLVALARTCRPSARPEAA